MSSWFLCQCGSQIHKNLLSGASVELLVHEEELDRDFSSITAKQLAATLVLKASLVLTCRICQRLHVVDQTGQAETRTYVLEA